MALNRRKRSSLFVKFCMSYSAFVVVTALLMGSISYFFAVRAYNQEIEKVNQALLQQYSHVVQSEVINRTTTLALNICSGVGMEHRVQTLFTSPSVVLSDVKLLYDELKYMSAQCGALVSGIHVYDDRKKVILSSSIGLNYLSSQYGLVQLEHVWLNEYLSDGRRSLWTAPYRSDYPGTDGWVVSYVRGVSGSHSCVAVDVLYVDALAEMFDDYSEDMSSELVLIDGEGRILLHSNRTLIARTLEETGFPMSLFDQDTGGLSYRGEDGRMRYASVSAPMANGWRMLYQADTASFYAASALMQKRLIIGACLAIALGILLAYLITLRMYRPIHSLTAWIATSLPDGEAPGEKNEYAFIDHALRGMNSHISSLTAQLDQSRDLLKSNLISSLVNGTIRSQAVLERRMALLGLCPAGRKFSVLLIELDSVLAEAPNAQEVELIKLNICQTIESLSGGDALYIAAETSSNMLTAVSFLMDGDRQETLEELALELLNQYQGHVRLGVGGLMDQPLELEEAFRQAREALLYRYFHPNWLYYSADSILRPALPEDDALSRHAAAFEAALRAQNIDGAINEVHLFSYAAQDIVYPFGEARSRLERLGRAMESFVDAWAGRQREQYDEQLAAMRDAADIRTYCYALCALLRQFAVSTLSRPVSEVKNMALVESVRQYVALNLAGDLSLGRLSEAVGLSGNYLSHIFRETTGVSIVDYVTAERLDRARVLLVQTDQSIESIAAQVGYPTHHYFSHRFRERYGVTPKNYRLGRRGASAQTEAKQER